MVAKEPYQNPVEENTDLQDSYEAEETLSLCGLPIYSNPSDRDDYSKEDQSLPQDDDFFEFLSEDFTTSTCATTANKNIIFCGKLIPYKELTCPENTRNQESTDTQAITGRKADGNHSVDFYKKKCCLDYSKLQSDKDSNTLSLASPKNHVYETRKCDFAVGKVSIMASPVKSRWGVLMFGMARFPTEMELEISRRDRHPCFAQLILMEWSRTMARGEEKGTVEAAKKSFGIGVQAWLN